MPDTILVTGGNGYIGSNLIEYYIGKGAKVHNLDINKESKLPVDKYYSIDITNIDEVNRIDDSYGIIFHCAGSASVPYSVGNPSDDFKINVGGTMNLLEFFRKSGSGTFVFLSTVSVFDSHNELPLTESSFKKPSSPYGAGKLASENYCNSYYRTYGVDTRVARIFNTYGPGMDHLFIADMIKKISHANDEVILGGSGNQIRDYVFITDVVKALVTIAEKGQPGEDYNVCSGIKITLSEITRTLLDKMEKNDMKIICDGKSYPGDIEKWYGAPTKLNSLGFYPKTGLEEGLAKTFKSQKG